MDTTFTNALNNWLKAVTNEVLFPQINKEWIKNHQTVYITLVTEPGKKYIRIVQQCFGQRSCWAFVALEDGQTRGMGVVKKGDIFKPAGWTTPAKTARGNIFDTTKGNTCGISRWTGPDYLK